MKFDLEKALAGQPVVLRNGTKAFVRHHETELDTFYPLFGYLEGTDRYDAVTWAADGHSYSTGTGGHADDIVGMWVEPAVFNHWDALEPKWKYIAADESGDVCVFTTNPVKEEGVWSNRREEFVGFMYVTSIINLQYTDWEHSLVERPSKE